MRSSVIVFPGSNCDRDIAIALEKFQIKNQMVWHNDSTLPKSDLVVLPGGFSYGDYLRTGCIAGKSKIINEVIQDHNVNTSQISIIGFSQGSMLATYYALQSNNNFHSIISLSGSLPSAILNNLKIVKNNNQYLIFHGKIDDVVSSNQAVETQKFLASQKISSKIILDENCGHTISPLALNAINDLYKSWI